jgi:hypothetical protein
LKPSTSLVGYSTKRSEVNIDSSFACTSPTWDLTSLFQRVTFRSQTDDTFLGNARSGMPMTSNRTPINADLADDLLGSGAPFTVSRQGLPWPSKVDIVPFTHDGSLRRRETSATSDAARTSEASERRGCRSPESTCQEPRPRDEFVADEYAAEQSCAD